MNHKNGFNPLSRTTAHRRAMKRNMVTSLFRYERITTTKSKALEARKSAEKLITRAKVDSVHNRRQAARFIADEKILNKLFTDIGPRMRERNGGYTRILKLGYRQGDAADMVILELVDYKLDDGTSAKDDAPKVKNADPKAKVVASKKEKKTSSKEKAATSKAKATAAKDKSATSKTKKTAPNEAVAESESVSIEKDSAKAEKEE